MYTYKDEIYKLKEKVSELVDILQANIECYNWEGFGENLSKINEKYNAIKYFEKEVKRLEELNLIAEIKMVKDYSDEDLWSNKFRIEN